MQDDLLCECGLVGEGSFQSHVVYHMLTARDRTSQLWFGELAIFDLDTDHSLDAQTTSALEVLTSIAVLLQFERVSDDLGGSANVALALHRRRSLLWLFDVLVLLRRLFWFDDSASSSTCDRLRSFLATSLTSERGSFLGRRSCLGRRCIVERDRIAAGTYPTRQCVVDDTACWLTLQAG
jgi:hypothetical protein